MRFSWTFRHSVMATALAVLTLQGQGSATAQFAAGRAQSQPVQQYQQYQQHQQPYVVQPGSGQAQRPIAQYNAVPQYNTPQYTAMAHQVAPAGNGPNNLLPQPAMSEQVQGMVVGGQPNAAPPVYESYPGPGCATGSAYGGGGGYSNYNTFANGNAGSYGAANCGTNQGYLRGANRNCNGRRWFGGVYGLLMQRDRGNRIPLAFSTTTPGVGYYPTDAEVVLTTGDVDLGYQGGAEIRFGSTLNRFGRGATYGAGGCGSCGPQYAWEAAYWGLAEETETSQFNDVATFGTDGNRLYGAIDFRGLEYNAGGGYRSVNDYYDFGPPTTDNTAGGDVEIRSVVARSTFSAQNIELNILRLPVFSGGSCWSGCNSGCGGGCAAGGCDVGGCATGRRGIGGYGAGRLGRGRPGAYVGPRYSLTTLVGARYMRFDEDFSFRSNFDVIGGTSGFLAYNVEADNNLLGFQIGCNGIYRFGCTGRCNSSLGLYGNRINVSQRMDVPTGGALRFANGTNANFDVESSKNDVAMLGELRLGSSYQVGSNWRLYGGWRVIGVTGIALSTNQIPTAFITPGQVGTIASNGSMLLHGLQVGTEWTY